MSWAAVIIATFLGLSEAFLVILSFRTAGLFTGSVVNTLHKPKKWGKSPKPLVSVIVPAYNEELTVANCVRGLVNQTYKNLEILIVNDGSKDKTSEVGRELEIKYPGHVKLIDKPNGGKATALNLGIAKAKGEIVVCIDADSIFEPETVSRLAVAFIDPEIAAVTGNVRISNLNKLLCKFQAIEYKIGINMDKRTFQELNAIQVITGCIGAFRKSALLEVGGYSSDSLIEDMDLTITLAKTGHKIVYVPDAMSWTEAPETWHDLYKQRYRWCFGKWQVLEKHKEIMFNKKFGNIGTIGIPYYIAGIWINILTSIIIFALLVISIAEHLFTFWLTTTAIFMIPIVLLFLYIVYIDKDKNGWSLTPYLLLEMWTYPYFIMYVEVRAWIDYKLGKTPGWNKLKRIGANNIPT